MNELQKAAIERAIDEQFEGRMDWVKEEIFKGCLDTDSTEKVCAKMILNGVNIATKIAAIFLIDFLNKAEITEFRSEDEIRKSIFSIVKE